MQNKIVKSVYRGKSPKTLLSFLHEVKVAMEDGWTLPENGKATVKEFPSFMAQFAVMMYKAEASDLENTKPSIVSKEEVVESDEDKVDRLSGLALAGEKAAKEDWLWLASKKGISIPEDMNNPLQIRKTIKEAILAQPEGITE